MSITPAVTGTYDFGLSGLDLSLEVLERLGIRGQAITTDHMTSLRRSANLVQSSWSNRGVNLWKVDLVELPLVQGVVTYNVDASTVMMLDVYLRNYQMDGADSFTPDFSTVSGSDIVTIGWPNHGLVSGQYMSVPIQVSVGGLILYGFYQVNSVPSTDSITIVASSNATATVNNGGSVPYFTTTGGSASVDIFLEDHGYTIGDSFIVPVSTEVGGIALSGSYTVANVTDTDNFSINAAFVAGFSASAYENDGACQLAGQLANAQSFDRIMTPISRNDYAALPNKYVQQPPTQYWFNRQAFQPQVSVYPVPDQNGPYQMRYYRVTQIYDAGTSVTSKPDVPYRFLEAYCAGVAAHMAVKWAPDRLDKLTALASAAWEEAAAEDRERVSFYLQPDFSGLFP